MLKNLKIGTRLTLGFGIILLLMWLLGIFAMGRMQAVDNNLQALAHDKWSKVVILDEIRKQNDLILFSSLKICLATDPTIRQGETERVTKAQEVVNRQIELLKGRVNSDAGKKLLYKVLESRTAYLKQQRIAMELAREGNREQIVTLLVGDLASARSAYFESVNALSTHQDSYVEQLVTLADDAYHLSLIHISEPTRPY